MDASRLDTVNLARTTTRRHVLHPKPRLVVSTGTLSVTLRYVPVDVALSLKTSCPHVRPVKIKPRSIAAVALACVKLYCFVSKFIILCLTLLFVHI
jgi:hypothetical protein